MTHVKNPKAKWYIDLSNRFEALMHNLQIQKDAAKEIKQLLVEIAKEQYMAGNRSGIRWARRQETEHS